MAPTRRKFDKKNSTTYAVVHRPQNDPLIHDSDASSIVYRKLGSKKQPRSDVLSDFGSLAGDDEPEIRPNEGEAAIHGVYFDDSKYDYMQHMKDLGDGSSGVWLEGPIEDTVRRINGKQKQKLEDALREATLNNNEKGLFGPKPLLDRDVLPNAKLRKLTYQDQQDVPDAIAGFQPDMDPRLREVLEALDNDEYVQDDEDMFVEIAGDGEELEEAVWDQLREGNDEDDGWESDATEKAPHQISITSEVDPASLDIPMVDGPESAEADNSWLTNFRQEQLKIQKPQAARKPPTDSSMGTSIMSGRRKKRKGALTSSAGYSMSSSSVARTDGLQTLDARFDKIEEEYNADDNELDIMDDESMVSGTTNVSGVSGFWKSSQLTTDSSGLPLRQDFDNIMDEFLGSYSMEGKRRVKHSKKQTGMEQLAEIRRGLGPARLQAQYVG